MCAFKFTYTPQFSCLINIRRTLSFTFPISSFSASLGARKKMGAKKYLRRKNVYLLFVFTFLLWHDQALKLY
jgi:hypothetical protein